MVKNFSFGENWQNYLKKYFSETRVRNAILSIKQFLGVKDLKGKTFVDCGCGSGLFSLAAYRMGAKKVVSFDMDIHSVKCCNILKEKAGNPNNWVVLQGSVLDNEFLSKLREFDVVYSWGVLHHTGKMWDAIRNVSKLISSGGLLYISIYNERTNFISSKQWLKIKKFYNQTTKPLKLAMEYLYILYFFYMYKFRFGKIKQYIVGYNKFSRGMSWRTDVTDWLGGYPYEYAKANQILEYCSRLELKEVRHTDLNDGTGCNEFLFKK